MKGGRAAPTNTHDIGHAFMRVLMSAENLKLILMVERSGKHIPLDVSSCALAHQRASSDGPGMNAWLFGTTAPHASRAFLYKGTGGVPRRWEYSMKIIPCRIF